jgi:hypothetical protein
LAAQFLVNLVKRTLPEGFVHPCPYQGELKGNNISLDVVPEMVSFYNGIYRVYARMYDKKDENIITSLMDFELVRERV